jgi:hypothetical protein
VRTEGLEPSHDFSHHSGSNRHRRNASAVSCGPAPVAGKDREPQRAKLEELAQEVCPQLPQPHCDRINTPERHVEWASLLIQPTTQDADLRDERRR